MPESVVNNRIGDWIPTITGRVIYPLDPRPEEIHIVDIAWALSMQCRYNGHTRMFYSVAEHSHILSKTLPEEYALVGLLHDASEAYLSDIPRPIKGSLKEYQTYEDNLMQCIAAKFGFAWPLPDIVKEYDHRILYTEKEMLCAQTPFEWDLSGGPLPGVSILGWSPDRAYIAFLSRYAELTNT